MFKKETWGGSNLELYASIFILTLQGPRKIIFRDSYWPKADILASMQASGINFYSKKNHSFYKNNSNTTLLTTKLWLRLCDSLAPLKKSPWKEKPISMKKSLSSSPLLKQKAITQLSMVLFKSISAILFSTWFWFQWYMTHHMGTKWLTTRRITWLSFVKE